METPDQDPEGKSIAELYPTSEIDFDNWLSSAAAIARALHHFHNSGHTHGNLCPEKVIIDDFGQVHLIDPSVDGGHSHPAYAAPEQSESGVSEVSDLYSVGVLFRYMLTGKTDTADLSDTQSLPEEFQVLLHRLLEPDPLDRINSARTLQMTLEEIKKYRREHSGEELPGRRKYKSQHYLLLAIIMAVLVVVWFVMSFINR